MIRCFNVEMFILFISMMLLICGKCNLFLVNIVMICCLSKEIIGFIELWSYRSNLS